MTGERLVLAELLEKAGEGDFLRAVAEAVLQLLMESDLEGLIGAARYERSGERTTWRNGYRDRTLDTPVVHVRRRASSAVGLLELAQALLPLALEAARNETVLGIDSAIAAFGHVVLVPGKLGGTVNLTGLAACAKRSG
jgi:hypothetical protein